jgi:hypothetical protein
MKLATLGYQNSWSYIWGDEHPFWSAMLWISTGAEVQTHVDRSNVHLTAQRKQGVETTPSSELDFGRPESLTTWWLVHVNMSSSTLHWYLIILLITWSLEKVEIQDQQNGLEEDCLQAISTDSQLSISATCQLVNPATWCRKPINTGGSSHSPNQGYHGPAYKVGWSSFFMEKSHYNPSDTPSFRSLVVKIPLKSPPATFFLNPSQPPSRCPRTTQGLRQCK